MDGGREFPLGAAALFAAATGTALGSLAAALVDAWLRLGAGDNTRATLLHVLGLLGVALVLAGVAAGVSALRLVPLRPAAAAPPAPARRVVASR